MDMEKRKNEVDLSIREYFKRNLPIYEVTEVRRKSEYEEDYYLYMVAAKKDDGTYAVWTCWNQKLQTLNHGHYGLRDLESCHKLMEEFHYVKG